MPAISVIIPAFNRAALVERAIQSVLNQTYDDCEIIVVDDGSTDDLPGVCSSLSHRRVRYIRQTNQGPAAARNTGVNAAIGEAVSFLDSDDTLLNGNLEALWQVMRQDTAVDVAHGWAVTTDEAGRDVQWTRPKLAGNVVHQYLFSSPTLMGTLLVRRDCLDASQLFDPNLALFEDWDFWLRLSITHRFAYTPSLVARVYFQDSSRNTSPPAAVVCETVRTIYAKMLTDPTASTLVANQRRYMDANIHVVAGHHYRLYSNDLSAARREFRLALRLAPDFRLAQIGWIESMLGIRLTTALRAARGWVFRLNTGNYSTQYADK